MTAECLNLSTLVVHIIVGLEKGGAEMMLRRLVEAHMQSATGLRHVVVSLTDVGFHGAALRAQGAEVHALGLRGPVGLLLRVFRLAALLRRLKPGIVQTWMVHSDLLGGLAARLVGVPHVIWGVRTTDYSVESRSTRAVRWVCARLSSTVPSKIVCAAQASLMASAQAGYDTRKLMVIPNGFDVAALRAHAGAGVGIRQQSGLQQGHVVVGCLGRYNPAKDHANFVSAAALLAARHPACRFLMVGRDLTSANATLMAQIQATGFADRFVLLGERSDPAACLDAMDVFVLSSCTEGFPNVLGEAMATGVPCVSTDVGDAAFLLGDAGPVVPARDSAALAQAVSHLLDMPEPDRQALGSKGRLRVENEFSMAAAAQKFNNLYQALLQQKP
jgi:glycosyltransferase involved in cell wall biosynthesis